MKPGLIIDNFAGGGGASLGVEMACWKGPDIAINHDPIALGLHAVNHPHTQHLVEDVWEVDPRTVTKGRPVSVAWFSPDCKHFSKAKGGKPVEKKIRGLAWVVVKWAVAVRPRLILIENVEEFQDWGPLLDDGTPCPDRKGRTFNLFVHRLRQAGYAVEWKELRACDYGAPTIRKRLFLIARCDGEEIRWPSPTHGKPGTLEVARGDLRPWRTAADCIDWSIPCKSIFGRDKPLAEKTLARIAKGVQRFVVEAEQPFILNMANGGRLEPLSSPMTTVMTEKRGARALVTPFITKFRNNSVGASLDDPLCTVTANSFIKRPGGAAPIGIVSAFMAQHNTGVIGHSMEEPVSTITQTGSHQALVSAFLTKMYGTCKDGTDLRTPFATVTAGGQHIAEVRAFLMKYYGTGGQLQDIREPAHTATAKARLGLVTVAGSEYQIVDIGMRMLSPRELFRAQGFPDDYVIDRLSDGTPITKTDQIRLCGNSVCPPLARALVSANFGNETVRAPAPVVVAA